MTEPMLLTMASGILATLLGVGFGCLVLELTVRAVRYRLTDQPENGMSVDQESALS